MKKSKFSEEQIATALRQIDAGAPVLEVTRKLGSVRRRTTSGGNATVRWPLPRFGACGCWRKKTADSSSSWPI